MGNPIVRDEVQFICDSETGEISGYVGPDGVRKFDFSPGNPGQGGAVSSVAGKTGAVTLTKSDVGLSNADNTSDAQKVQSGPIADELSALATEVSNKFTAPAGGITEANLAAALVTKINTAVPADGAVTPQMLTPSLRASIEAVPPNITALMARLDALEALGPTVLIAEIIPDLLRSYSTVLQGFSNQGKKGWVFGTSRTASQPNDVIVNTDAKIDEHFTPFLPGTGKLWINSQIHAYAAQFGPGQSKPGSALPAPPRCHFLDADGLRFQANVASGAWDTYLRGQVNTTNGININPQGSSVVTTTADAGVPDNRIADIRAGDVVLLHEGAIYVAAVNAGAKTLVFRSLSHTGPTASVVNYKVNYALEFTRLAVVVPTQPLVSYSSTVLQCAVPVPAQVVPGCFAMFSTQGWDPKARGDTRVESISPDRLTVTFDAPIESPDGDVPAGTGMVLFLPQFWSAQINTKETTGPVGCDVYATSVRATYPNIPFQPRQSAYTKTDRDTFDTSYPSTLHGYWAALGWQYAPDISPELLNRAKETDSPAGEFWIDYLGATNEITFHIHRWDAAGNMGTRVIRTNPDGSAYPPGASWRTESGSEVDSDITTPNVFTLVLPANKYLLDGQPHTLSSIETKQWILQYIDDEPVCITYWDRSAQQAPYRLISNLGVGGIARWACGKHFMPRSNAKANAMTAKVHEIRRARGTYNT